MTGAVEGDAELRLSLRKDRGMTQDACENGSGCGRLKGRQNHDRGRSDVVGALLVNCPEGALLHPGHVHHAVVLAVSAAACGQAGIYGPMAKERHDKGLYEKQHQRDGQQASHLFIIAERERQARGRAEARFMK